MYLYKYALPAKGSLVIYRCWFLLANLLEAIFFYSPHEVDVCRVSNPCHLLIVNNMYQPNAGLLIFMGCVHGVVLGRGPGSAGLDPSLCIAFLLFG